MQEYMFILCLFIKALVKSLFIFKFSKFKVLEKDKNGPTGRPMLLTYNDIYIFFFPVERTAS